MNPMDTISSTPIQVPVTLRPDQILGITSCFAGVSVPLKYIPLNREEALKTSSFNVQVKMDETVGELYTPVAVEVKAVFIPNLAFERFGKSLDRLNRSYKGEPDSEGGPVIPYFNSINYNRAHEIWRAMGIHAPEGVGVNDNIIEAYNTYHNHQRRLMSNDLPMRDLDDTTLAEATWKQSAFRDIKGSFDQAMIDGEVALNIASSNLPVTGITRTPGTASYDAAGISKNANTVSVVRNSGGGGLAFDIDSSGVSSIAAELQTNGITLSLSNIERAKETAVFAQLRKQYKGHTDDFIIDLLMDGIRVPEAQEALPILLDKKTTIMGLNQRYATDGANLDQSVSTGETLLSMKVRLPATNTGGIILILMEIVPEQLFERARDPHLFLTSPEQLPKFLRDYLDPEKVEIVQNKEVDVLHTDGETTFGYRPLNNGWKRSFANIGGKYFRQAGDPFDENRQKIWAVETLNPTLNSDFYLVNSLHHKIFADNAAEPFEITTLGSCQIAGNTVFGGVIEEDNDDYTAVAAEADDTKIDQSA